MSEWHLWLGFLTSFPHGSSNVAYPKKSKSSGTGTHNPSLSKITDPDSAILHNLRHNQTDHLRNWTTALRDSFWLQCHPLAPEGFLQSRTIRSQNLETCWALQNGLRTEVPPSCRASVTLRNFWSPTPDESEALLQRQAGDGLRHVLHSLRDLQLFGASGPRIQGLGGRPSPETESSTFKAWWTAARAIFCLTNSVKLMTTPDIWSTWRFIVKFTVLWVSLKRTSEIQLSKRT